MLNLPAAELEPTPEERRSVVRILAYALAAGMLCAALGCAAPAPARAPECSDLEMAAVQTPAGTVYVMDDAGLRALSEPAFDKPEA